MRGTWDGRAALAVGLAALLWGVMEGATYPASGPPRVPLALYWPLLIVGLVVAGLGFRALLDHVLPPAKGQDRLVAVLALLPLALALQDATSLLVQGSSPQEATWYAAVFGAGPHTSHDPLLGLPAGYWMLATLSLLLLIAALGARPHGHARA